MVLLKTVNGIFSACDRFMLKIFFCGVKRMYMGIYNRSDPKSKHSKIIPIF